MISARKLAAFAAMLALGGCPPAPTPVVVYNNSGQDLTLHMSYAPDQLWRAGEYLIFDPRKCCEPPEEALEPYKAALTDAGGRTLRFSSERKFGDAFDFISHKWGYHIPPRASRGPEFSCDFLRIEPDLSIVMIASRYQMSSSCGRFDLATKASPEQPLWFPILEGDLPPLAPPDPRSIWLGFPN
jgi:hypothetical protein